MIGAGDVTLRRILPALRALGYQPGDIAVTSIQDPDTPAVRAAVGTDAQLRFVTPDEVLKTLPAEPVPTIIASPTPAHFPQLATLAAAGIPFAVEKPIASRRSERAELRCRGDALMAGGFALSYYTLEKALPLTYFRNPLPGYAAFLTASEPGLLGGRTWRALRDDLGEVRSVRIDLLEDASRSPSGFGRLWTEVPGILAPFIETTIHPLMIMRHVTEPGFVTWQRCALGRFEPRAALVRARYGREIAPTWVAADGTRAGVALSMRVAKYVPTHMARRTATVEYAGGTVRCDFDRRTARFVVAGRDRGWLAIDSTRLGRRYGQNYAVQLELFRNFITEGWGPARFDDFTRQLDALDTWDDLCDKAQRAQVPIEDYTQASIETHLPTPTPLADP